MRAERCPAPDNISREERDLLKMQNLFEPLFKLLKPEKIDTDNLVFRFHYKVICIKESENYLNLIF